MDMTQNQKLDNSRILITGGAGFIGSNLCEELFSGTTPTQVEINDWLWFNDDFIFRALGYNDLVEDDE